MNTEIKEALDAFLSVCIKHNATVLVGLDTPTRTVLAANGNINVQLGLSTRLDRKLRMALPEGVATHEQT